jgi:hypothetical protein
MSSSATELPTKPAGLGREPVLCSTRLTVFDLLVQEPGHDQLRCVGQVA